jgi:hypothetical protein
MFFVSPLLPPNVEHKIITLFLFKVYLVFIHSVIVVSPASNFEINKSS